MKKVVLCTNPTKDKKYELTKRVYDMLEGKAECVVAPILDSTGRKVPHGMKTQPIEQALKGADLMISFGGDGTILKTARLAAENDVPILSINLGRLGFLTELEDADEEYILRALKGDYKCDSRMMLDVVLSRGGEAIYSDCALNDAVISNGREARGVVLKLEGDGVVISEFYGDGVILSSPTGSTGYSMSAGGPVVEPSARNILITPICAHSPTARCFVLPEQAEAKVIVGSLTGRQAYLSVDGGKSIKLKEGDAITATASKINTKLVRVRGQSFYDVLNGKFDIQKRWIQEGQEQK